jgi:lipopolysaccharide/colanic/teichoic acid biosynthesis glycosyltransferase
MVAGAWYRLLSVVGTVAATTGAVLVANSRPLQSFLTTRLPGVSRLGPRELMGDGLVMALLVTIAVVAVTMAPLYKPRPRRILGVIYETQRRVLVSGAVLATVGYFDYTYRLPRVTLLVTSGLLLLWLPIFFLLIRRQPAGSEHRVLIVGDSPSEITTVYETLSSEPIGYVGPATARADGGSLLQQPTERIGREGRLGGLSRLAAVIVKYEIETAAFAFKDTDRGEFFGALATCHDHGVNALIRRERADSVLVSERPDDALVTIDIEPWDWQERAIKRAFDIAFASTSLLVLSPLVLLIGVAIKVDDGGPILYRQERTAELGRTFPVYKFRSMAVGEEAVPPGEERDRVTRIGTLLRSLHLDEIPQLWSILAGDMSVVGPRAAWINEEHLIEEDLDQWRQRWFVKPGLTGLAQINDVSSKQPAAKLRFDLTYIRRQSLRFDIAIVVRQLWIVGIDAVGALQTKLAGNER